MLLPKKTFYKDKVGGNIKTPSESESITESNSSDKKKESTIELPSIFV